MTKRLKDILWVGIAALTAAAVSPRVAAAPIVEYSQDGKHYFPFDAVEGDAKASTFYDYHDQSGHPGFGTPASTATAALYWDRTRNALSLIAVNGSVGSKRHPDSGQVVYKLSNLPWSTYLALSDDPKEFIYNKGDSNATARFTYGNNTDGLILGGLERPRQFTIKVSLDSVYGMKNWRLIDAADGGDFASIVLNLKKPLYLRMSLGETDGPTGSGGPSQPPVVKPVAPETGNSNGSSSTKKPRGITMPPATAGLRPTLVPNGQGVNPAPVIGPLTTGPGTLPGGGPGTIPGGGPGSIPPGVPEPGSILFAAAALGILGIRRRR